MSHSGSMGDTATTTIDDSNAVNKQKPIEREASFDLVRKLVKKEGIEAKNLVSWHVPLNETLSVDTEVNGEAAMEEKNQLINDLKHSDDQSTKSETVATSSALRMKGGVKRSDFRSRQWSYLFDNLRRTVDAIYDTCYFDQSIIECKEAIMILENCTKDFQAMIDYLNNQAVWEKSDKPIAMAWEVRKTAGSPNKHFPPSLPKHESVRLNLPVNLDSLLVSNLKATDSAQPNPDGLNGTDASNSEAADQSIPITNGISRPRRRQRPNRLVPATCAYQEVVLPAVKKVAADSSKSPAVIDSPISEAIDQPHHTSPADTVNESEQMQELVNIPENQEHGESKLNDDEGWEVVCYARGSRRNSVDGKYDKMAVPEQLCVDPEQRPRIIASNQQQISPKLCPKSARTSVFPRNAQEIRQTKSSLGKMVYNRQYLADQRQKEMADKLKLFDSRPPTIPSRRRAFAVSGSSISLPSLSRIGRIGINFSDPEAVKRSAQALKAVLMKGGGRSKRFRSYQSMESVQSLESIKEEDGGGLEKELMAKMVETIDAADLQDGILQQEETRDATTELTDEMQADNDSGIVQLEDTRPVDYFVDGVGLNEHKSEKTEVAEQLALENAADADSDETWKHLTEEEESLAQEEESIQKEMEEERKSIDFEMSRQIEDDDGDEGESNEAKEMEDGGQSANEKQSKSAVDSKPMSWQELVARWEAGPLSRTNLCWGDMVEMELAEVRSPGQAVQVHEKLSSPSRQKNLTEAVKKREERRTKAYEMRQQILEQRHQRMRELSKRVEEVQEARQCLLEKKKAIMEERLAKAEENRNLRLLARVKKAHDEDEKVNEIAFINTLEAGNKRLDVMTRQQDLESRLQTIQDERQRRCEEKAAREAAAEERRKVADERRQVMVNERAERTRRRQEQIEQQRCEHERERQQLAREKAREREERLAELKAAKQANTEELLQRIQHKQEESMRRHEENLEQIKQRASEMSTPRSASSLAHGQDVSSMVLEMLRPPSCQPYVKQKLCTVCNILIPTDVHLLAHLKGKRHAAALKDALPGKAMTKELADQENQKCIVEASDEKVEALSPSPVAASDRVKLNRKRRQRLRQKLQSKAKEYSANATKQSGSWQSSQQLPKMLKSFRDIGRCLDSCGLDKQWLSADVHTLERSVGELTRILSQQGSEKEQEAFHGSKIQDQALLVMSVLEKQNASEVTRLPMRSVLNVCNMLKMSILNNAVTSVDMVYSNRISSCIEALSFQLQCLNQENAGSKQGSHKGVPQETVVVQLMSLVTCLLETVVKILVGNNFGAWHGGEDGFKSRLSLVLSYMVACGIVDQVGAYCAKIVELPMEGVQHDVVLSGFQLITTMLKCLLFSNGSVRSINEDATQMLEAIRCTELCNLMPILYSVLLSPNTISSAGDRQTPPKLPESTVAVIGAALDFVNCTGAVSRQLLQDILGQEGSSLEFRHVASFLISYGNRYECQTILHRIIVSVGHFTVLSAENQALVHFGSQPSILQQLCVLPFAYFSDKKLTRLLYPTLIACTYQNEASRYLLEQEMSCTLLSDFLKQRMAMDNEKGTSDDVETATYSLEWRFPRTEWKNAVDYFETPVSSQ